MAEIKLTNGKKAIVDDEDYYLLNKFIWQATSYSKRNNCYACRSSRKYNDKKKRTIMMHRFIMGLNEMDTRQIDHINGDGLDNRKINLRICSRHENLMNKCIAKNNKSGFKGVHWYKNYNKWVSEIRVDSKKKHLGYYI